MSANLFLKHLPKNFVFPETAVGQKLLAEYGAVFVARNGVTPPERVIFQDEAEVERFQSSVIGERENIGGLTIELQKTAMDALRKAAAEAEKNELTIKPRNADAARRSYSATVENWASRVEPGLKHWVAAGKLAPSEAERISRLTPFEQVAEIFALEAQGLFFAKNLSKSIIYSVAPPGASQHISMLALDVAEFDDPRVREILTRHGWFQTIPTDLPHFTYLGAAENELPNLGLRKIVCDARDFWIPDL